MSIISYDYELINEKKYNMSILHCLFDQYLIKSVNATIIDHCEFFTTMFKKYIEGNQVIKNIDNLITRAAKNYDEIKDNLSKNYETNNIRVFNQSKINLTEYQNNQKTFKKIYTNINDYIVSIDSSKAINENFMNQNNDNFRPVNFYVILLNTIKNVLITKINHYFQDDQFVVFASCNNLGQMINFLCEKIDDKYNIYMFNMSNGLEKHVGNKNSFKCIIANEVTKDIVENLLVFVYSTHMFNITIDMFYETLEKFVTYNFKNDTIIYDENLEYVDKNNKITIPESYYSLYLLIKFYIYKNGTKDIFNNFWYISQVSSINLICEYIDSYIEKNDFLPELFKSYIDIIQVYINKFAKNTHFSKCLSKYVINMDLYNKIKIYYNNCVNKYPIRNISNIDEQVIDQYPYDNKVIPKKSNDYLSNINESETVFKLIELYAKNIGNYNSDLEFFIINKIFVFKIANKFKETSDELYKNFLQKDINILINYVNKILAYNYKINITIDKTFNILTTVFLSIIIKINEFNDKKIFTNEVFNSDTEEDLFKLRFYKIYGANYHDVLLVLDENTINLLSKYRKLYDLTLNIVITKDNDTDNYIHTINVNNFYELINLDYDTFDNGKNISGILKYLLLFNPHGYIYNDQGIMHNNRNNYIREIINNEKQDEKNKGNILNFVYELNKESETDKFIKIFSPLNIEKLDSGLKTNTVLPVTSSINFFDNIANLINCDEINIYTLNQMLILDMVFSISGNGIYDNVINDISDMYKNLNKQSDMNNIYINNNISIFQNIKINKIFSDAKIQYFTNDTIVGLVFLLLLFNRNCLNGNNLIIDNLNERINKLETENKDINIKYITIFKIIISILTETKHNFINYYVQNKILNNQPNKIDRALFLYLELFFIYANVYNPEKYKLYLKDLEGEYIDDQLNNILKKNNSYKFIKYDKNHIHMKLGNEEHVFFVQRHNMYAINNIKTHVDIIDKKHLEKLNYDIILNYFINNYIFKFNNKQNNKSIYEVIKKNKNTTNNIKFILQDNTYTFHIDYNDHIYELVHFNDINNEIIINLVSNFGNSIIIFYCQDKKEYLVIFTNTIHNNDELLCIINNNNMKFIIDNVVYNVVSSNNMYNKWVYCIPYTYLVTHDNNNYKILLIENIYQYNILYYNMITKSIFYNEKNDQTIDNQKKIITKIYDINSLIINKCYLINIHTFGFNLYFNNIRALKLYYLLCIFYNKSDILKDITSLFVNTVGKIKGFDIKNNYYLNYDNMLNSAIANGLNSPFNIYFKYVYDLIFSLPKIDTTSKYLNLINNNYHYNYDIINKNINQTNYDIDLTLFYNNYIDESLEKIILEKLAKYKSIKKLRLKYYELDNKKFLSQISIKKIYNIINEIFDNSGDSLYIKKEMYKLMFILVLDRCYLINTMTTITKSEINIDDNIYSDVVKKFEYGTCKINDNGNDIIEMHDLVFKIYNKIIDEELNNIYYDSIFNNNNIIDIIIANRNTFYIILQIKNILQVFTNIKNVIENKNCYEIHKLKEPIDPNSIFTNVKNTISKIDSSNVYEPYITGTRSMEIIIFEILFANLIRKEQYDVYNQIIQEIKGINNPYSIYQLLMGRGKTSVILPLIILKTIHDIDFNDIKNILLVFPEQLLKQARDDIIRNYSAITNNSLIKIIDHIPRNVSPQVLNELYVNFNCHKNNKKNIILCDKNIIQSIKLIEISNKLPSSEDNDIIDDDIFEDIKTEGDIIEGIKTEGDIIEGDIIEGGNDEKNENLIAQPLALKKVIETIKNESLFIFDEFDSSYDPLKSELNFPLTNDQDDRDCSIVADCSFIDMDFLDSLTDCIIGEQNVIDFFNDYNGVNKLFLDKFRQTYIKCSKLLYNYKYGFPKIINGEYSHIDKFFAVPYSHVNQPLKKSNFSDFDIKIILTLLSHVNYGKLHNGIMMRKENLDYILKEILGYIKIVDDKPFTLLMTENVYGNYIKDIIDKHFDLFLTIRPKTDKYQEILSKLYDDILNDNKVSEIKEFIKRHLKILIGNLKLNIEQYNISFIDVISKNVSKFKTGFSGTVNINLPIWLNDKNEFTRIKEIEKDKASTYVAILGLTNNDNKIHLLNNNNKDENYEDIIAQQILKLIKANNYSVLIDSGAFFRNKTTDNIIEFLSTNLITKKYFIYMDNESNKKIFNNETKTTTNYLGQVFNNSELFIYYDNKHIVGIDIKQPFILKGLATINNFNRYTDISQAIYRMRNLNFGHSIDFILTNEVNNYIKTKYKTINRSQLLIYLLEKDTNYINEVSGMKYILQNIKYLLRIINDKYYKEKKYIEYEYFGKNNDSDESYYIQYLNDYIGNIKNKNVFLLINQLKEKIINIKSTRKQELDIELVLDEELDEELEVEEEEEEAQEQEEEEEQELSQENQEKFDYPEKITYGHEYIDLNGVNLAIAIPNNTDNDIKKKQYQQVPQILADNNIYISYNSININLDPTQKYTFNKSVKINTTHNNVYYVFLNDNFYTMTYKEYMYYKTITNHIGSSMCSDITDNEGKQYFLRYLYGKKLNFTQYPFLLKYIFDNENIKDNINYIIDYFKSAFGAFSPSENIIQYIIENYQDYDEFLNNFNNMPGEDIAGLIFGQVFSLDDQVLDALANFFNAPNNIVDSQNIISGGYLDYYAKYKKYKHKYLKYKKSMIIL